MIAAPPDPRRMSAAEVLDELALYLRPPGQGVFAVSTGRAELAAKTARYLESTDELDWRERLAQTLGGRPPVAILAVPCDTGAGIVRGASRGPEAIRARLERAPCADLGDVIVVPQLLDDEMCSPEQLARTRAALFPSVAEDRRRTLPASPLSLAARALKLLRAHWPTTRVCLLGGDHSVAWPAFDACLAEDPADNRDVGVVHFDAHTDLLPERLGVRMCFATWAHHLNERLGRGRRLVQIGIRASSRDRAHWQGQVDVEQIWAEEALHLGAVELGRKVVAHLLERDVRRVYVTNDIDGTDARWASACGTPEPGGLEPDMILAVLDALAAGPFEPLGADVVELAPGLSLDRGAAAVSVDTATRYTLASLAFLERGALRPSRAAVLPHAPAE